MNAYIFLIVALAVGILYMGMKLVQRVRMYRARPDDEKTTARMDVQRLLRKHLEQEENDAPQSEEEQQAS